MANHIYLDLPKELSDSEREEILNQLKNIEGIEDSEIEDTRVIDPVSITAYIVLATSAIAFFDKAVPVVQKIKDLFKKRGLKNVDVTLPDGTKITLEEGNVQDVERLASALTKQSSLGK